MKRLSSIDAARGLVMLLMLVDHVRESFYIHAQVSDPVSVVSTPADLFFTRLCAHLCAPVFILLTGLGASLFENKNTKRETTSFLFKRGLFLIVLELTLINFGWSFSFTPSMIYLQVIWAIGLAMISLSALIWLPPRLLIALGLAIVIGHNLLDPITFSPHEWGYTLWAIIHDRSVIEVSSALKIRTSYPVLPWIGVIILGYAIGPWFKNDEKSRSTKLLGAGLGSLLLFVILRAFNQYGDFYPWGDYGNALLNTMSFLNLTKYPPSLDFLLLTIGTGLIVLSLMEKRTKISEYLSVYGSTPMFFYVVHIYLLNVMNRLAKLTWGPNQGIHFSAPNVLSLWLIAAVIAIPLYFMCQWYGQIKRKSQNPILKYF